MSKNYNFFHACTLHHVFMSLSVIVKEQLKNNKILFFGDPAFFKNDTVFEYLETISKDLDFELIDVFKQKTKYLPSPLSKLISFKKAQEKIRQETLGKDKSKTETFYIFTDERKESQYLIHLNRKKKNTSFYFVQDGLVQYVDLYKPKLSKTRELFYKLIYGSFWKSVGFQGGYYNYDGIYAMAPEALLPVYNNLSKREIKPEHFYSPEIRKISYEILKKLFPDFLDLTDSTALLFLPYINSQQDADIARKQILNAALEDKITKLYLKNHPRSKIKITFSSADNISFKTFDLPSSVPAELFFAVDKSLARFYLTPSTLLLIAAQSQRKLEGRVLMREVPTNLFKQIEANKNLYEFLFNRNRLF